MKCIYSHSNNPYFNLAAEEYLLRNFTGDFYFQYVNSPSVVIGKHQNAMAEVDMLFLEKEGIPLARRISGGGAVYHDEGNVNYSFITNESPGDFIQFRKYTAPVISVLSGVGVQAALGKRNELVTGERKISGTASHVFRNRVLHHGTLLYDSDLGRLAGCLYVDGAGYIDKAVKSVRSEVLNIIEVIPEKRSRLSFYKFLFEGIQKLFPDSSLFEFSNDDQRAIERLMEEKFTQWEWNYGYSPNFTIERQVEWGGKLLRFKTTVVKGIIKSIDIEGEASTHPFGEMSTLLIGQRHHAGVVETVLRSNFGDEVSIRQLLKTII